MIGLGQGFHYRPWTAFGMRIYEQSVNFVGPNPKLGAVSTVVTFEPRTLNL